MRSKLPLVAAIVLFALPMGILVLQSDAQRGGRDETNRFSKESMEASEVQKKLIKQELDELKGHPWAGAYYSGYPLGANTTLMVAPKAGFAYSLTGCLGPYDLNYGGVVEVDGKIKLVPKFPNEAKGSQSIPTELLPIVWGNRHYLIPANGVVEFTNAINAGFEPRKGIHGSILLRRGDEFLAARDQPNIPAEYSGYILKHPIKAGITSVEESRTEGANRVTFVVLSSGSAAGVKEGMEFHLYSPLRVFDRVRVTKVEIANSEAEIVEYSITDKSERPSPGWKLSTRSGN